MCKCCGFKSNIHTIISVFGLSISILEFICAAVYNFHFLGFSMAIIGIVCSGLYLSFNLK